MKDAVSVYEYIYFMNCQLSLHCLEVFLQLFVVCKFFCISNKNLDSGFLARIGSQVSAVSDEITFKAFDFLILIFIIIYVYFI